MAASIPAAPDDYGPVDDDDEFEVLAGLVSVSFGVATDAVRQWLGPQRADARVYRRQGRVLAGLTLLPMGQFFGGRRVSQCGVAGVAVAPDQRGQGLASALMTRTIDELASANIALSVLYPATYPLYRNVGFELAGGHYRVSVPAHRLPATPRRPEPSPDQLDGDPMERDPIEIRPVETSDEAAIRRMYRRCAIHRPGWLDRSLYIWRRVFQNPGGLPIHSYVAVGERDLEGYVCYRQEPVVGQQQHDLVLHDLVSTTGPAARRLLGFLASHSAQARDVVWYGGVDDPHAYLLPERGPDIRLVDPWMLRIIDVTAALSARGYPSHLSARLDLELTDALVPKNCGRFRLDIDAGRGAVTRGGRGSIALDTAALATIYSGHMSPYQLASADRLRAPAAALARMASAFAGPPPSLPDAF
ncbi:MAG: GNAT family N-acetyltransferase [Haliangiales bacterium]